MRQLPPLPHASYALVISGYAEIMQGVVFLGCLPLGRNGASCVLSPGCSGKSVYTFVVIVGMFLIFHA